MPTQFAYNNEEAIIAEMFQRLPLRHEFCVDIGAGDGLAMSNTHFLFAGGWRGLAVEYNPASFAKLAHVYRDTPGASLARAKATPDSILPLLAAHDVPRDFDFLSLDIDGYDHAVLDRVLSAYRPTLICSEINEMIPPPVKFVVNYHPDYAWHEGHFFGHSIAQVQALCDRHDYGIVHLEYNNVFLAPNDRSTLDRLTPERAYREGYLDRPDRLTRFPWNATVEHVQQMSPPEVVAFLQQLFAKYRGQFECSC